MEVYWRFPIYALPTARILGGLSKNVILQKFVCHFLYLLIYNFATTQLQSNIQYSSLVTLGLS